MIEQFKNYLQKSGIELVNSASDGIYFFSKNQLHYMIVYNQNEDANYFRILLPNVYNIQENEKGKLQKLINDTNSRYKVAKITTSDDSKVWISVESFFYSYEGIENLFSRLLACLDGAFYYFINQLNDNNNGHEQQ